MRFDPNTCRMVEDEWRHRSPHYDLSPRVEEEHWIWKVIGISMLIVWAAIGFNWLDDHYSWGIVTKVKSYFIYDEPVAKPDRARCPQRTAATWGQAALSNSESFATASDMSEKSIGEKVCRSEALATSNIVPRPTKLNVVCCVCGYRFDATQFSHYAAFDCDCPGCGSIIHVENHH